MISNLSHVDGLSFMRLPTCSKLSRHRFGNHPRLNWTKQTYFHLAHHRVSLGGCEVVTKPIHAHCTIFHGTAPSLPGGAQPTSYNLAIWNSKASIQTVGDVGAVPFLHLAYGNPPCSSMIFPASPLSSIWCFEKKYSHLNPLPGLVNIQKTIEHGHS
jgi:hypothetical protein